MNNKTRLLALLLAVVMMVSVLASCADGNTNGTGTQTGTDTDSESAEATGTSTETEDGGSETDGESDTVTETETEETSSETASETESVSETVTERPTETESNTERETESETESESESDSESESEMPPYVDPASCSHYNLTRWTVKEGTLTQIRICVDCGIVADSRTTQFSVGKIKVPQSYYQTSIILPAGNSLVVAQASKNTKIVIPTLEEYNLEIEITGLEVEGGVLNNTTYYSVDEGRTWKVCTVGTDSVSIALRHDMFTGANRQNATKATNRGILFGFIPGYLEDYVTDENYSDYILEFVSMPKTILTPEVAKDGGHHDESLIVTSWCKHNNLESRTVETANNGDGTVTYTYRCSECDAVLGISRNIPESLSYYWSPFTTYYFDNKLGSDNLLMDVLTQGNEVYVSVDPSRSDAKLEIFPANCADNSVSGYLGRYVAIKYRATGSGYVYLKTYFEGTAAEATEQSMSNGATDGWVVAIVDVSECKGYEEGANKPLSIRIGASLEIDIAYVAMANDIADLQALLKDGETYYYRGTNFASFGAECNKDGSCKVHDIAITETSLLIGTIYTYKCPACGTYVADTLITTNKILYLMDYFTNTYYDKNQDEPSQLYPRPMTDGEDIFVRYAPSNNIGGEEMQATLTYNGTSSATSAFLGKYLAIRYRTTRIGTNSSYLKLRVEIDDRGGEFVTNTNCYTNGEWVTAIIDISGLPGYDAEKVAAREPQKLRVDIQLALAMDVSHMVIVNDITDITRLLGDDETYVYHGNSFANVGAIIKTDGSCKTHGVKFVTERGDGETNYKYVCPVCGEILGNVRTLPDSTVWYADLTRVERFTSGAGTSPIPQVEDGKLFLRSEMNGGSIQLETTYATSIKPSTGKFGKYIAIKYRITDQGVGDLALKIKLNNTTLVQETVEDGYTGDWVVAVIDVSGYEGFDAEGEELPLLVRFTHYCTIDVEYVMMTDELSDIRGMLGEGETYVDRGNSFANAGIEYNKDGTPVSGS